MEGQEVEDQSFKCNDCGEWSRFTKQSSSLQYTPPSSWTEDECGYHCGCDRSKTKRRTIKLSKGSN